MFRIVAGTVLLAVLAWQAWRIPAQAGAAAASRIDQALQSLNGTLANVNATTLAGKNLVEEFGKDYYDPDKPEAGFYWDIYSMLEASRSEEHTSELQSLRHLV